MKRKESAYWAVCCWLGLALLGYGLQPLVSSQNYSQRQLLEHTVQKSLLIDAESSAVLERQQLLDMFLSESSNFELVPARMMPSRNYSSNRRSAVIDRGSESRLLPGLGVICSNGVVGKISQVGSGWSRIQLIDDPAFVVPFQDELGQRGILAGGPFWGTGYPKLRIDPIIFEVGDILYTDGSGGVFPPAVYLGIVEETKIPVSDSIVRLPAGIDQRQEILVLVPLDHGGTP